MRYHSLQWRLTIFTALASLSIVVNHFCKQAADTVDDSPRFLLQTSMHKRPSDSPSKSHGLVADFNDRRLQPAVAQETHRAEPVWWPENCTQGTAFFIHVPHGTPGWPKQREGLSKQVDNLQAAAYVPQDVAFILSNNRPTETPLARAFRRLGFKFYVVGTDYRPWDWWGKVGPLIELLESGEVKEQYVVMADADDMFPLTSNFADLVPAFKSYDAKMVLGATYTDHPKMPEAAAFERAVYPWAKFYRHGQSSYMAYTRHLLPLLKNITKPWLDPHAAVKRVRRHPDFDDQAAVRELHMRHYPEIKVDTLTHIFLRSRG